MKYNPEIHHRKSLRLKGYDYSQPGSYFITVCCDKRISRFGSIENDKMILNEFGSIAFYEWTNLTTRYANIELGEFQIMPNHIHGIVVVGDDVGAPLAGTPYDAGAPYDARTLITPSNGAPGLNGTPASYGAPARGAPTTTIGNKVGAYKSLVFNACLEIYKTKNEMMGKLWQRNFHEHIIRDIEEYQRISTYIINNPSKWEEDTFYMK